MDVPRGRIESAEDDQFQNFTRPRILRERHDTLESQASSVDFSDELTESDYLSDNGSYGSSPSELDNDLRRTMSDQIAASLRRYNIRHSHSADLLPLDEEADDSQEPVPPVLQRSTTFERVLSDAIVHQSPLDELKVILEAGAKLIDPSARKPNPLHYTVWQRYPEAAELLLQQGYDVDALDDYSYSALHLAARHGYTEMMRLLIAHGAKVNFNDSQSDDKFPIDAVEEPLRLAIKYGHKEAAKLLLDHGANTNTRYFFGSEINLVSPLMPEMLELLLLHGANVNEQDRNGLTPIMKACRLKQGMESLLLLLSYGGDVNIRADARHDSRTALHYAVLSGSVDIIHVLLDSGAQIIYEPEYNKPTPLHLAVRRGDIKVINILLDHDINSSTSLVGSVLHMACSEKVHNRLEVMELLLDRGADPNIVVPGLDGSPILPPLGDYLAASDEHDPSVINLLLKYGAEVILKSSQTSPLGLLGCLSSLREHPLMLEELLEGAQQFDLHLIRHTSLLDTEQRRLCLEVAGSPLPLRHISRIAIRHDSATSRPESVLKMALPSVISKYLLYEIS
ncbi:Ankyrin repeat domain-containing protein [Hyalella azteca]|uniref:Ankyrin repeat domain-containing protein n=1 Tax=Hyalella azteca TaxID=294128 RepID=A0A6A0GZQ8_HYAAZ|nr:Ankyrin repeat domain-containing protein [Hyalella azteca]